MTDATTHSHGHAHDHGPDSAPAAHSHAHSAAARPFPASPSLLEFSAGARLLGVSLLIALIWAGVYWALH